MQTIDVKSHIPSHLRLRLSWGDTVQSPETSDFIRLDVGDEFAIPAGHATSIRTPGGWQKAYAFEDTIVTGPVDISTPQPMPPKDFSPAPLEPSNTVIAVMFALMFVSSLVLMSLSGSSFAAQFSAFLGSVIVLMITFIALIKVSHRHAKLSDKHGCAQPEERTFWRADLTAAQREKIRPMTLSKMA